MDNPYLELPPDADKVKRPVPFESVTLAGICNGCVEIVLPGVPPEDVRVRRYQTAFMRGAQAVLFALHRSAAAGDAACGQQQQDLAIEMNRWLEENERQAVRHGNDSVPRIIRVGN